MHSVLSKLFPTTQNVRNKDDYRNPPINVTPASGDFRGPRAYRMPNRNPNDEIGEMLRNNAFLAQRKGNQYPMVYSHSPSDQLYSSQMKKEQRACGDTKQNKNSSNKKSRQSREHPVHPHRSKNDNTRGVKKVPVEQSIDVKQVDQAPIPERPATIPTKTFVSSTQVHNGATIVSTRDEKGHMHVRVEYGRDSIMRTAQSPYALLPPANMKKIVMDTPEIISRFPKLHGPRSMVAAAHINCVHPPIVA